jgi:hypothetical protein
LTVVHELVMDVDLQTTALVVGNRDEFVEHEPS